MLNNGVGSIVELEGEVDGDILEVSYRRFRTSKVFFYN